MPARTVFLAGHAKLPQAATAQSVYDDLVITVEIDVQYSVIIRASCNLVTELGRDFVARLLVGRSLQAGVEDVIAEVQAVYQGAVQNAVIAALRDLARRYEAWRRLRPSGPAVRGSPEGSGPAGDGERVAGIATRTENSMSEC